MKWKSLSAGWPFAAKAWSLTGKDSQLVCQTGKHKTWFVHYSGVFLLQENYWEQLQLRSEYEVQQHTFVETRNAINTLCRIATALQQGSNMVDLQQGQCTFFLVGLVYQGISALMTIENGDPSVEIKESIIVLRWLLRHIRSRWPLSSESLGNNSLKEWF
jgi:hypothetical protein